MMVETLGLLFVDTISHYDFFDSFLTTALRNGCLPRGLQVPRTDFRDALVEFLSGRAVLTQEPVVVFVGGGYGAGKTTVLTMLGRSPGFPLPPTSVVGVDFFKLFLPEYEVVRRLGDGRASSIVQAEARKLAGDLFSRLLQTGRSFMWDSSMSDFEPTRRRIEDAKARGYRLNLVAVECPVEAAVAKAMQRARLTRRFAHPAHLHDSHRNFTRSFPAYFELFDDVKLFWNPWKPYEPDDQPRLIAEKVAGDNKLVSYCREEVEQFLALADQ